MKQFIIAAIISSMIIVSQAWADNVYTIYDNWKDWPEFESQIPGTDDYGTPKIDHMDVTLSDTGILLNVDIYLKGSNTWQEFNSLFINSYADSLTSPEWDDWDYLVHDGGTSHSGYTDGTVPGDGIFTVADTYVYTMTDNTAATANYHRQNNPNGIDAGSLTGNLGEGSGWINTPDQYLYSYSFDGVNIDLSDGFFIAFAPFCANDVIGGGVDLNPVPEPATMAMVGLGLLGIAGIGRKRQKMS